MLPVRRGLTMSLALVSVLRDWLRAACTTGIRRLISEQTRLGVRMPAVDAVPQGEGRVYDMVSHRHACRQSYGWRLSSPLSQFPEGIHRCRSTGRPGVVRYAGGV